VTNALLAALEDKPDRTAAVLITDGEVDEGAAEEGPRRKGKGGPGAD